MCLVIKYNKIVEWRNESCLIERLFWSLCNKLKLSPNILNWLHFANCLCAVSLLLRYVKKETKTRCFLLGQSLSAYYLAKSSEKDQPDDCLFCTPNVLFYNTTQHNTTQHNTTQRNATQRNTIKYNFIFTTLATHNKAGFPGVSRKTRYNKVYMY